MAAPHIFSGLTEAKRAARIRALAARAGCDPAWGEQLAEHVLADFPPPPRAVVAGFWSLPGEISLFPLLHALHERGHAIVLPVTPPLGQPLTFRCWQPGDVMERERFGTYRPIGAEKRPDFVLVPLLAFDRNGHRLGYGGGYYDRTLPTLPHATRLGCAFAAQEMADIPVGPLDVKLHAVATERGVVLCCKD
jgi:5-formyltetrahydrofolate cyclo-ligase